LKHLARGLSSPLAAAAICWEPTMYDESHQTTKRPVKQPLSKILG
jgi:hypothetical protein